MATIKIQTRPDLYLIRGDSSSIDFSVDMDLTDATVFFTAKSTPTNDEDDSSAVIKVEVTEHTDPENGTTVIPLSSSDTDVEPGKYYYDIQIKKGDEVTSIPGRRLQVVADITRRTS